MKKIEFNDVDIETEEESENTNETYYKWNLWEIKETFSKEKSDWIKTEIKINTFFLDKNEIKKAILINLLKEKKLLDIYTYEFLTSQEDKDLEVELKKFLNFHVLLWNIKKEEIKEYKDKWLKRYNFFIIRSNSLIKTDKYTSLSKKLHELEDSYKNTVNLKKQNIPKNNLLNSNNVKYVLDKLLNDKTYNASIIKVSEDLNIDKKLLISSIWVEQIRYMTTVRWYAKNLIKSNKYLTNFSKFSYWIWWIKLLTARRIQGNMKKYNLDLYNKYFIKDVWVRDATLIKILTNKYKWTLYSWALISNIQDRWEKEWFPLEHKPWVIITLYNMWNVIKKVPHSTPDLWWSLISIDWKSMYFWEIWYVIYYYLKYYIE
jgi:hypothetical protein